MNLSMALKLFALGMRWGLHHSKLGFEPNKMSDEDAAQVLREGFEMYQVDIDNYAAHLNIEREHRSWFAEYWTAKQAYIFGVLDGFTEYPNIKPDRKGKVMLTKEVIDKLYKKKFYQTDDMGAQINE